MLLSIQSAGKKKEKHIKNYPGNKLERKNVSKVSFK